jgi:hypothetical protein
MNKKLIVGLLVPALMAIAPISVAQANQSKPNVVEKIFRRIQYTASKILPLKALGYPKTRKFSGGKRGICSTPAEKTGEHLMAIVPNGIMWTEKKGERLIEILPNDVGLTSSSKPSVWLYSPYNQTKDIKGTLVLRKFSTVNGTVKEDQIGREMPFNIPTTPGAFSLQVEEKLEKGSLYKWVVTVKCDKDAAANPTTGGFITFDQPIQSQSQLTDNDKLIAAAEQGYWYDLLNVLLNSRTDDSQQQLDELLKSGKALVDSQRILKR